jgi:hypothetical protein
MFLFCHKYTEYSAHKDSKNNFLRTILQENHFLDKQDSAQQIKKQKKEN